MAKPGLWLLTGVLVGLLLYAVMSTFLWLGMSDGLVPSGIADLLLAATCATCTFGVAWWSTKNRQLALGCGATLVVVSAAMMMLPAPAGLYGDPESADSLLIALQPGARFFGAPMVGAVLLAFGLRQVRK